jgi:hypothetical protein
MIEDAQNKMVTGTPEKKQFLFAATVEHYAEVVYAETIQEAEAIYHKVKRLITQETPAAPAATEPAPTPAELATPLSAPTPAPEDVQS